MNELFETGGLYANTDSSYADEKDHGWSTMGQILMMNGGPVHQKSYEYKAQMKELGKTLGEPCILLHHCLSKHIQLELCSSLLKEHTLAIFPVAFAPVFRTGMSYNR